MGIPLLKGRDFTDRDTGESSRVVMINEALARRFWPNEDPVGKRVSVGNLEPKAPWSTIVGVVGDVRHFGLDRASEPEIYRPYLQAPLFFQIVVVRTLSDPMSLVAVVRNEVMAVDKDQSVFNVKTMEEVLSVSLAERGFTMLVLGSFALLALVLAAVGIYGVTAYSVTQRTYEIGIRMAPGAQRRDVLKLVVKQGMLLVSLGVAIGLIGSLALTRVMSGLLFGVSPTDLVTFAGITLLLGSVALLACYIPARRATQVDPMVALGYE